MYLNLQVLHFFIWLLKRLTWLTLQSRQRKGIQPAGLGSNIKRQSIPLDSPLFSFDFPSITAGMSTSYCTFGVINILILIAIVSIGINIGSIIKSGRALEAYPSSLFYCPYETGHLRTFLVGGVVSSTFTLLTTTTTCVFTVLVWTLTKDFVHGRMFVGMTAFNGVFSAFQLVWAILGMMT